MNAHIPRSIRAAIVLATAAAVLAIPFQVAAAPKGTRATFTVTPLIAAVSVGQPGAFEVFVRNDGPATFTHATLTGVAAGGSLASAPSGCTGSGPNVTCQLGKISKGQSRTLVLVFGAPAAAGSLNLNATLRVDAGSGNPSASSEDVFNRSAALSVRNDPDFFGRWQQAHNAAVSFTTGALGGANHQSTSVVVPPVGFGYAANVEEIDDDIVCDGNPVGGIGQAVEMTVANGQAVNPYLEVKLTYDKTAADGKTPSTIEVVHQRDDGTCEFPPRDCDDNEGFCYDAKWSGHGSSKKLIVTVQLPTNGRAKGV